MTRRHLVSCFPALLLLLLGFMSACKTGAHAVDSNPAQKEEARETVTGDAKAPQGDRGTAERASLTLVTWNIYWFSGEEGGKAPRDAEDIALLESYRDKLGADVIALQEIDGVESLRLLFPQETWQAACEQRDHKQQVCLVVKKSSGWAIEEVSDYAALNTNGYLRAGLDVTLTHPDASPLRLLAVHMKSGCFANPPGHGSKACEGFYGQLPHLETWIDARAREGAPFVVLGDFNRRFSRPGDEAWAELDDADPEGLTLARSIEGEAPCWDKKYPEYIDHIVLGGAATEWIQSSKQLVYTHGTFQTHRKRLSDHCPLAATLSVPGR